MTLKSEMFNPFGNAVNSGRERVIYLAMRIVCQDTTTRSYSYSLIDICHSISEANRERYVKKELLKHISLGNVVYLQVYRPMIGTYRCTGLR